jgi:cytochrome c-type biogenesis protein
MSLGETIWVMLLGNSSGRYCVCSSRDAYNLLTLMKQPTDWSETTPAARRKWSRKTRQWLIYIGLGILTLVLILVFGATLSHPLERAISIVENRYQEWFAQQETNNPFVLLSLAFLGGVLASVSPCILALLPVNLSYIGTLKLTSRWDALFKSGLFVLGAVTILSLFGLVSSFAGAVMVDFRGYINVVVGLIMAVMGLWLMGVVRIPLPTMNVNLPNAGPYGVGLTFALVSSPCASPVLFAVLAAAAGTGSQLLGTLTMVSYALGYTLLIFLASLFTGLAKSSRALLQHSEAIIRVGSVALIMTGVYYLYLGSRWFMGI